MLKRIDIRSDRGLTLVEVVVGTAITALISVTLFRLGSDASIGLDRAVDRSVAQVTLGNFAQILRSDLTLSSAVTVYGNQAPTYLVGDTSNTGALCGNWLSGHNATNWNDPSSLGFTRTLFSMRQSILASADPSYVDPAVRWVGYELRSAAGKDSKGIAVTNYSLWRVTCGETAGLVDLPSAGTARKLVDFGVNFDGSASGATTLFCGASTAFACATSGTSGIDLNGDITAFTFKLPFLDVKKLSAASGGQGSLTNRDAAFANALTINMQRKIG